MHRQLPTPLNETTVGSLANLHSQGTSHKGGREEYQLYTSQQIWDIAKHLSTKTETLENFNMHTIGILSSANIQTRLTLYISYQTVISVLRLMGVVVTSKDIIY